MTTRYPYGIDSNTELPRAIDLITPVQAEVVNQLRDAIIAIETELGIDPSRDYLTVRQRLDAMELGDGGGGDGYITVVDDNTSAIIYQVTTLHFAGALSAVDSGTGSATVSGGYTTVIDENTTVATDITTLKFVGDNVQAVSSGGHVATISVSGGDGYITVMDEGSVISTDITTLNFVGDSVQSVVSDGYLATITVSGSDSFVKVSAIDTTDGYLSSKLSIGYGLTAGILDLGGGNLSLRVGAYQQVINHSLFAGANNDVSPPNWSSLQILRLDSPGIATITGFLAVLQNDDMLLKIVVNIGSYAITLMNENLGSSAPDRILTSDGSDLILEPNGLVLIIYDQTTGRWRTHIVGTGTGGGTLAEILNLGNTTDGYNIVITNSSLITSPAQGVITVATGDTSSGDGGGVSITTGAASSTATSSGSVYISTGSTATNSAPTGQISIFTGSGTSCSSNTGTIAIYTGPPDPANAGYSGDINIYTSPAGSNTGSILVYAGQSNAGNSGSLTLKTYGSNTSTGGDISIETGTGGVGSYSGDILIKTNPVANAGNITITASGGSSVSGNISVSAGNAGASNASAGNITITSGSKNGANSVGGDIVLQSGSGTSISAGNIFLKGSVSNISRSGCIFLQPGAGGPGLDGYVHIIKNFPGNLTDDGYTILFVSGDSEFDGDVSIDGKLTVSGLIDPTGLVLDLQSSVPGGNPASGHSTFWIRQSDGYAVLTDSSGNNIVLNGTGSATISNLFEILTEGNSAGSLRITNLSNPISQQDAATRNYVDGYIAGLDLLTHPVNDGYVAISDNGDLIYIGGATDGYVLTWDAAEGIWESRAPTGTSLTPTLSQVLTVGNSAGSFIITNLSNPISQQDAATRNYVDGYIASLDLLTHPVNDGYVAITNSGDLTYIGGITDGYVLTWDAVERIWESRAPTGTSGTQTLSQVLVAGNSAGSLNITNLADPIATQDAATRNYVDGYIANVLDNTTTYISFSIGGGFNNLDGWKTIGSTEINSVNYSSADGYFEAVLYSTSGVFDGYLQAEVRLMNITTGLQIGSTLTVDGYMPTFMSESITISSGSNIYEAQIRLSESDIINYAICTMSRINVRVNISAVETADTFITPTDLSTNVNDYNPTGFSTATALRLNALDDGYIISGFDAAAAIIRKEVINIGTKSIVLSHQDVSSSDNNRIISQIGGLYLNENDSVTILYDPFSFRWRVV